ncbi:MAG TPA: hypothetical protein VMU34_16410 [Mycobacterium sp.]|nr:hypothetical protein [Mycobacterium sp.]
MAEEITSIHRNATGAPELYVNVCYSTTYRKTIALSQATRQLTLAFSAPSEAWP